MASNWGAQLRALGFKGDFDASLGARQRYATDASVYEQLPQLICWPRNVRDLQLLVQLAAQQDLSITMRGAGTSLAGQAIGDGVIVDTTRYLNRILALDLKAQTVTVEPGVVLDELNAHLKTHGLWLALDTSTANRCVIGGVVGNNSCGAYSVAYGTPRDQIVSVDAVLSDAQLVRFAELTESEFTNKLSQNDIEGVIYRCVGDICQHGKPELSQAYPDASIIRRNTGYALDVMALQSRWQVQGGKANLAPLICGSEGTLALVTAVTFKLKPLPRHRALVVVQFDDVFAALDATPSLLCVKPIAVELIDEPTMAGSKGHAGFERFRFWLVGDPEAVQVVELAADSETELSEKIETTMALARRLAHAYDVRCLRGADMTAVWQVRKAGLGLLMGKVGQRKAVAVIEDAAVPVSSLSAFMRDIRALMAELSVNCIYYGHASVGLIHLRPELDLTLVEDKHRFVQIAQRVSALVKHYKGALSGEHGDGRLRGPFLREQLGDKVYGYCVELKRAFDPNGLFNPNRIISQLPIDSDWRHSVADVALATGFDWSSEAGFGASVEKCNGAGACRQSVGAMCPSFQVTRDDEHSTRGRANLLRFALQSAEPKTALSGKQLSEALSSCLSCKACKSECPASVDMSRLKSEVLYQQRQAGAARLLDRLLRHYHRILPLLNKGRFFVKGFNALLWSQRKLPLADGRDAQQWWIQQGKRLNPSSENTLVVLVDIYSRWLHPQQTQATIRILQHLGYAVEPIWLSESPRLLISHGFLAEAKSLLASIITEHGDLCDSAQAIVGIEPAELLVWRDDGLALLADADKSRLTDWQSKCFVFEEAILALTPCVADWQWPNYAQPVAVQMHCHQRSLVGFTKTQQAFALIGVSVQSLSDGCCGMAGSFGYQQPELSFKIAQKQLLPNIDQQDKSAKIIASGSSCQQQMSDLSTRKGIHPALVFAEALNL